MEKQFSIHVGTLEQGLFTSSDKGETWKRPIFGDGVSIRALCVDPIKPYKIYAGSDNHGLFQSNNNGVTFEKNLTFPESRQIWSIAVDPSDSDTIYIGTRPGIYRSKDCGETWQDLPLNGVEECAVGIPRTTGIVIDPIDNKKIWAGAEVDGIFKSVDGGDSWNHFEDIGTGKSIYESDVHSVARNGNVTYAGTPFGLARTENEGETWDWHYFPSYLEEENAYCRAVVIKPDDLNVMYVATGDGIPGVIGGIQRTIDGGKSWERVKLPIEPKSVMYWISVHAKIPNVVVSGSLYGFIYISEDAGKNWIKIYKEFGELRAIAVSPN